MSKMTTEQFLSHLGIEVEQEFKVDDFASECVGIEVLKYRINKINKNYFIKWSKLHSKAWYTSDYSIRDLLDKEITPLPKYTLTEDESELINGMRKGKLKRFNSNCVAWEVDNIVVSFFLNSYFKFVEETIDIEELRKCL